MEALPSAFWRISNHADLTGSGGLYASGRWHKAGQRVVYLAESPPGALLEILVHLELPRARPPLGYQLLKIEHDLRPGDIAWEDLRAKDLADEAETQPAGQQWLARAETVLARVPSAIMPQTNNWLLNPQHTLAASMQITHAISSPYDPRLIRHIRFDL